MMQLLPFLLFFVAPTVYSVDDILPIGAAYLKLWDNICPALLNSPFVEYNDKWVNLAVAAMARIHQNKHMQKYDESVADIDEYFEYAYPEYPFVVAAQETIEAIPALRQKQCDPKELKMLINDYTQTSCQQLCMHCLPGSMPLCYSKSRRYPGIAQTCLCTYATEEPFSHAAFSIYSQSTLLNENNERYKHKRELVNLKGLKSVIFV